MKFSNKLSSIIFITGAVLLVLLSFTTYKLSYNSIIKSQFIYTESIAKEVSENIDHLLDEKVKTALTLANTPMVIKGLETSNSSYAGLSDEKREASINLLNEKWRSTKDPTDNFILKFTDNKLSLFLKDQQSTLKGEYGEIFLTNKFGALVASTSKLSTFAHGHKYWWLGSYNNGKGAVFFDDRGYDDSVGGYVLGLVVPIRKSTEIIGILKCNLNILGSINQLISGAENKLIGRFKLVRSGGMVVFEEGFEPLSTQIHDSIFKKLKIKNTESFIINDLGEKYIVGLSEISVTKGENGYGFGGTFESIDHKKGNTGESWYVICYRQMRVILLPVTELLKSIIWIGITLILILVLVSFLFGRKIAEPIAILDEATEKIGEGNFEYRIDTQRNDEFGNLAHSFNSMVSRLQQTTTSIERLQETLEFRDKILSESPVGIAIYNADSGQCVTANKSMAELIGASEEQLFAQNFYDIQSWKESGLLETAKRALRDNSKKHQESTFTTTFGKDVSVDCHYAPFLAGNLKYLLLTMADITARKYADGALLRSEEKYRSLYEKMRDGFGVSDMNSNIVEVNKAFSEIIGYSEQELYELSYSDITPRKWHSMEDKIIEEQVFKKGYSDLYEKEYVRKDGSIVPVELRAVLIKDENGNPSGVWIVVRDISERKQAEDIIIESLKEKELLLSEIHHRVKNNMQVIVSLLRLQSEKIEETKYAAMLKESEDRILSMVLVHEQLYQSQDFANIDFGEYVNDLLTDLFISYGVDQNKIKINIVNLDILLNLENAIPCGLIINELVSNSLKYAFPDDRAGKIEVSMIVVNEDEYELTVSDDGVGIPEDLDIINADTMGLHLVRILSEKTLDGKMDLNRTQGTRFQFLLKRAQYKPRI